MHSYTRCIVAALLPLLVLGVAPSSAQVPDSSAAADSLLLELQREMGAFEPEAPPPPVSGSTSRVKPNTNPDISLVGDLRASYLSEGPRNVDFEMHEAELALKSVVDPYARADAFISMANDNGEFVFELEEAYLTTLALPHQLEIKAGKYRSNVGKINQIHPHALPFIDTPALYSNYLGDEGLNDQGIALSWLVPNGAFYQDWTVGVSRGPAESESFVIDTGNQLLYTTHLKNFWDLTDNTTFELGLTGMAGPNDTGNTSWIGGVDLTYKWKPVQFNRYRSLTLQAESFFSKRHTDNKAIDTWGMYALADYRFAERWNILVRYDFSDKPDNADWNERAVSSTLGWTLTEFQKIEFGARRSWNDLIDTNYAGFIRLIFVIGTHGAHVY